MALIRFSNLVNDIRGSSGGNTFSRGLAGATVSMKRTVSVPEGRAFRKKRSAVQSFTKLWRSLSENDRRQWNALAKNSGVPSRLGILRYPSGLELFTSRAAIRSSFGLQILSSPVAAGSIPSKAIASLLFRLSATGSLNAISLQSSDNSVRVSVQLRISSKSYSSPSLPSAAVLLSVGGVPDHLGFGIPFFSLADPILNIANYKVGESVFAEYRFVDSAAGVPSPWLPISAQVTSL